MLKGTRKYWAIAILCGLMASFFSYQYMQKLKTSYSPDEMVTVVRAKENIRVNSEITAQQVEVAKEPANYVSKGCLKQKDQAIGKVAIVNIAAGEEILSQKLLSSSNKSDKLSYQIPVSKRAVSIPINSVSGVSGYIQPGDHVDILGTLDITDTTWTVFALQNIEVLAVGNNNTQNDKKDSATSVKDTLVLAVAPEDVQRLVLVSEKGSLRVLLRSPADKSVVTKYPYQLLDVLNK